MGLSPGGLWLALAGLGVVLAVVCLRLQAPVSARIEAQSKLAVISTK